MKEFDRLVEIVKTLRSENGCPWDREQTLYSLKNAMIEEAHELLHALDAKDIPNIEEELGDLLLHIVMHADIAESDGLFKLEDVINGLNNKLVRRHPHVFGEEEITAVNDVIDRWAEIKKQEKQNNPSTSILDNIPHSLPSLSKAQKIQKRASKVGFDWENVEGIFDKLSEEIEELKQAYSNKDKHNIQEEIGDMLFVITNLASHMKVDADESLRGTITKFKKRFSHIEQTLNERGEQLEDTHIDILEELWIEAKKNEY